MLICPVCGKPVPSVSPYQTDYLVIEMCWNCSHEPTGKLMFKRAKVYHKQTDDGKVPTWKADKKARIINQNEKI